MILLVNSFVVLGKPPKLKGAQREKRRGNQSFSMLSVLPIIELHSMEDLCRGTTLREGFKVGEIAELNPEW